MSEYLGRLTREFGEGWNRFWFTPTRPEAAAAVRIGIGLVSLLLWFSLLPSPMEWLGQDGLLPIRSLQRLTGASEQTVYRASLFLVGESSAAVWGVWSLGAAVLAAATLGLGGRLMVAAAWVMVLSLVHRIPMVTGLAEPVLTMAWLYLIVTPATAVWSLDARLRARRNEPIYRRRPLESSWATIGTRLLQLHTLFFYAVMAATMMRHATWWEGEAVWTMLASSETRMFDLSALATWPFVINALTFGIVGFEIAFLSLIWQPLLRPALVVGSFIFWAVVAVISGTIGFPLAMAVLGLVFWDFRAVDNRLASR